jgi:voltage-gated potassium channel
MTALDSQPSTGRSSGSDRGRTRRHILAAVTSVTRIVIVCAVLLIAYGEAPWDRIDGVSAGLWLAAWFAVLALTVGWHIRAVMRSAHPWARAAESAALSVAMLLLPFATAYALMSRDTLASFTQGLTRIDALYFTVTVFATVGFGDIAPVTEPARVLVTVQMLADLILIGVIVKVLAGAAQQRRRALRAEADSLERAPGPPIDPLDGPDRGPRGSA